MTSLLSRRFSELGCWVATMSHLTRVVFHVSARCCICYGVLVRVARFFPIRDIICMKASFNLVPTTGRK
jgi:hypothetical protein